MGPNTLFDKSFLQSLSLNESVWLDHFFLCNVCPIFFVETLSDLEKSVRVGRTPEREVELIADKFPEMAGTPNVYHVDICVGELMRQTVPMNGQIILPGGHPVKSNGRKGVVVE